VNADKVGILGLGASAAVFAGLYFHALAPERALPPTLCLRALYLVLAVRLFLICKCGKDEPRQGPATRD